MKSLVLAEKPSVARDIARVLKCHKNLPGAIEGNSYVVTWALGHLVTLADPESYDKKFKEWNMSVLPMIPKKWELVVIKQTSKQYQHVKTQLFRKDISEIIIATVPVARASWSHVGFWISPAAANRSRGSGFLLSQTKRSGKDSRI